MDEVESRGSADHPPVEAGDLEFVDAAPPRTKWPKVIGIISLIYAIGGLLCQVGYGLSLFVLTDLFMGMGGIEVEMPMALKLSGAASAVVLLVLGFILLLGAIKLLQRKRSGVTMHKFWAVTRLLWLLVAVAIGVVMLPTSIAYQRDVNEATNRMLTERDQPRQEFKEEQAWRTSVIMFAVTSGLLAVYPLFVGFYLSRRKIADEVSEWE